MKTTIINQTENKNYTPLRSKVTKINSKVTQLLNLPVRLTYSVVLVDSAAIQLINHDYRKLNQPTDVISFAYNDGIQAYHDFSDEIGDIFINLDFVVKQALDYGHTAEREYLFLVTHGLLHLLGYDHMNPKDETEMFGLQKEILNDIAPR